MSGGGRQSKPGETRDAAGQREPEQPRLAPGVPQRDPAWVLKDPMRLVRAEREAAVAQINRSLKAWRKQGEGAARGNVEIPQSGGAPLAAGTRAKMEARLGADLSDVKVHTGGAAASAAEGLGARAFTVGADVHFGAGEYQPGTKEGDRLLAHELTHVVQGQRSGVQRKAEPQAGAETAEQSSVDVSDPNEPAEKQADATADQVTDNLHGGGSKQNGASTATVSPAPISAKLVGGGRKISLAPRPQAQPQPPTGRKILLARSVVSNGGSTQAAPQPLAPGAAAAPVNLATACAADPVAKQKYQDVLGETQPRAAAMKPTFLKEAEAQLQTMPTRPLEAMRSVVRGGKYFLLGNEIPSKAIADAGGVSRVVDLPSIYRFYLDPSYRAQYPTQETFCADAAKGKFDPVANIDDRKLMRGAQGVKETWWFPSNEANAVDLDGLRKQLYIHDNPAYEQGAVRCDLDPEVIREIGVRMYKPTAFDGMMQGWGTDPWWVTKPGTWGITKNDTHEAVQKSLQWRFYKSRHLIKPTNVTQSPMHAPGTGPSGGTPKPRRP